MGRLDFFQVASLIFISSLYYTCSTIPVYYYIPLFNLVLSVILSPHTFFLPKFQLPFTFFLGPIVNSWALWLLEGPLHLFKFTNITNKKKKKEKLLYISSFKQITVCSMMRTLGSSPTHQPIALSTYLCVSSKVRLSCFSRGALQVALVGASQFPVRGPASQPFCAINPQPKTWWQVVPQSF